MKGIFNRLRNKLFGGVSLTGTSYTTGGTYGLEHIFDIHNLKTYKESLYLYIGVSMIAQRAASIPLELHRIVNTTGETDEVFDHQLLDLFHNPNALQTQREFMEVSIAHYLLSGDCFWYAMREGNRIQSLVPLYPHLVDILLSTDNTRIIGYQYRAGDYQRLAVEDVVHIKNPDPTNYIRGVGVVRPATTRIATEKESAQYQANFFRNQGRPDIAVFFNRNVSQQAADEARKTWKDRFGNNEGGNVGFFGNEYKEIRELNATPKEMDFIETQKFLRDDILAALRVPKAMVTSDDVNLANSKEAYRMYLQEAVIPVIDAFIDVMNNRLNLQVDDAVFWTFKDPTPNDREMELREVTELKRHGIISANEARQRYDYDQVEGADELSAGGNNNARIELENQARQVLRSRPMLVRRLKAAKSLSDAVFAPKRSMTSIFPTKALKAEYAKAVNARIDRQADTLKEAVDRYHAGLLERILASDLTTDGFMNKSEERRIAKSALLPVVERLYKQGGQQALDDIFRKSADTFFADTVLLAAISERVEFFTASMTDTTFDVLRNTIGDGLREGQGVDTIARRMREHFTDMSVKRARTIAQTETNYALSKATNDAYNQSSVVTGKEWISVGDINVRDEHQANELQGPIHKGAAFSNGEEWPGQRSVNCRCVLAPAV